MPTAPSWDASGAWTTIFAEDFAEGSLDLTRWHNGWFGSGSGTSGPVNSLETAVYSTANVSLSGGYLNMLLTPTANGGKANTGSLINTDPAQVSPGFAFVHGAAEARVFVPATADGTQAANWIAWWVNGPDGTGRGEFDVIEALHGSIESHIPTAGNPGFSGPNEPYTGWHNFGVNWSTGQVVTFYYDGVSIGSANVTNTGPMYLVINNTVGTNCGGLRAGQRDHHAGGLGVRVAARRKRLLGERFPEYGHHPHPDSIQRHQRQYQQRHDRHPADPRDSRPSDLPRLAPRAAGRNIPVTVSRYRDYGPDKTFPCGHCGTRVEQGQHNRNSCPACHWSRHVMFGEDVGCPPCGGMMQPVWTDATRVLWDCLGCGFVLEGPAEKEMKRIKRTAGREKVRWRMGARDGDTITRSR